MKKLDAEAKAFVTSVRKFCEFLEDHYESPVMADKLAYFRECLVGFTKATPVYADEEPLCEQQKGYRDGIVQESKELLHRFEGINADSNVFDIIDLLRFTASRMDTVIDVGNGEDIIYDYMQL